MAPLFRRLADHLTRSTDELEADELSAQCTRLGTTPIAEAVDRTVVDVSGTIRHVTMPPRGDVATLVAEIYDGSGTILLTWLGRREIPGIAPGAYLRVHGRVCRRGGRRVIFNPRYELLARTQV